MATADTDGLIGEPLDTLEITINSKNGIQSKVKALNIGFMEPRQYMCFRLPPPGIESSSDLDNLSADEEEWMESMSYLEDDLVWILRLPHHRFWSQVKYDEDLHRCLESYLSQGPRDYDMNNLHIRSELSSSLKKIHKLVFLVFLRMSTYKESKTHHIRPIAFGEIIYDFFLFDIPKLMDLCVLYGLQNRELLRKMIENIFSSQPRYLEDLNETSQIILNAFNIIEEKVSSNMPLDTTSLHESNGFKTERDFSLSTFRDIVSYVADISATLHSFLEIYPPGCQVFHQNGAAVRISSFYEQIIPVLEKEISYRIKQQLFESEIEDTKQKIVLSKTLLIKVFRNILSFCYIQHILNVKSDSEEEKASMKSNADHFLEIFTQIAPEKIFIHDYNIIHPFETDLELFNELGLKLDSERIGYIFSSIHDTGEVPEKFISSAANGARPKIKKKRNSQVGNLHGVAAILNDEFSEGESECTPSEPWKPKDFEMNSLIQSVLDVLPTLGEGFIEMCLEHYFYNVESVIDAVLQDSLPDHLKTMDRNTQRMTHNNPASDKQSVLSARKNIYDNDEFDIFNSKDINMKNIHIGKKDKTPTVYESLPGNTADSFLLKEMTLAYGSADMYEDEYDDTYDSMMVGMKEPALEGVIEKDEPVEERINEEPEENKRNEKRSLDFCTNPEILRQRAAERRESKLAARGGRRGGPPPSDPEHSRQQKDRHKSNVANHGRRKQADFKKSRGMMPF